MSGREIAFCRPAPGANLGYAERSHDIEGHDAVYKLAVWRVSPSTPASAQPTSIARITRRLPFRCAASWATPSSCNSPAHLEEQDPDAGRSAALVGDELLAKVDGV
jgi:hypothetical protein